MRAAERVLVVATGILIVAVIVLCWGLATALQVDNRTGNGFGIPWPIIWAQIASTVASVFALVGLASAAGLLFLRAARWTSTPTDDVTDDEKPTPEPSP
jgi:hypothetical protein